MRKKSITSLIIVYIALCVSYGALSSRFIPTSSGAEEYVQSTVSNISAESDVSLEKETSSGERKSTDKDTEKETPSLKVCLQK